MPYDIAYRIRTKSGRYVWVRDAAKFRRDKNSLAHTAIGVFVDIDDTVAAEKKHQEELEAALAKADRAARARTDFLRRISHDMRTLLNGILGLLRISCDHPDDAELARASRQKMETAARSTCARYLSISIATASSTTVPAARSRPPSTTGSTRTAERSAAGPSRTRGSA